MSNYNAKRRKTTTKEEEASPSWSSLPDAVALSCLARVSKSDLKAVSLVSKRHHSLVDSPELCRTRTLIGCTEPSFYVCLRILPNPTPRWFILTGARRLRRISSIPCQAPEASSFVVVDWGIYVIGGLVDRNPTSDVWLLDCFSHTWCQVPSMKTARASASASLVDGKIYVFGGCGDEVDDWAEVFDPKTQTWSNLKTPKMMTHSIYQSAVIEKKKVYAVDEDGQSFYFSPSESRSWTMGRRDCMPGKRNDWCAIGKLLYCVGNSGRILWCEPDELDWKEVKGLEELQHCLSVWNMMMILFNIIKVRYDISRLCCNSSQNIVIFWNSLQLQCTKSVELRSAEISLEVREGCEVWGKIEWSGTVFNIDPQHSVESGNSRILEQMRRGYTREAYMDLVKKIRSIIPDVAITSDFITGFCGETEEEHEETLSLVGAPETELIGKIDKGHRVSFVRKPLFDKGECLLDDDGDGDLKRNPEVAVVACCAS